MDARLGVVNPRTFLRVDRIPNTEAACDWIGNNLELDDMRLCLGCACASLSRCTSAPVRYNGCARADPHEVVVEKLLELGLVGTRRVDDDARGGA